MSRIRTLLATAALIASAAYAPAQAQCVPNPFPVGWLQAQEVAGGHTIAQHVGKTDPQLAQRLTNNPHIQTASTYPGPAATAEGTITAGVATNRNVVNNWANLANAGATQAYDYIAGANIGRNAVRNANPPPVANFSNTCTFRAVFRATGGGNCFLLTSYPTVPNPGDCP